MLKHKKMMLISFLTVAILSASFFSIAPVKAEQTQVTDIYRLSHPAFSTSNTGQNARQPWNVDKSRILLNEGTTATNAYGNGTPYLHPDFPTQRGTLSSAAEPFKSEEAWTIESDTTYKRHWRRDAQNPRLWLPDSLQEWKSEINKFGIYTKYTGNKGQVVSGAPGSWFYDNATDYIYVKTFTEINPSTKNIKFVSNSREYIWGCLTESCLAATDNPNNMTAARAIDATLPALDFDGVYNLDAAGKLASLAAWEKNTIDLPEASSWYDRPHWSPYADEPNIIYKLNRYSFMLTAFNVDTGVSKDVLSYNPATYGEANLGGCSRIVNGVSTKEIDLATAQIYGFSKTALNNGDSHQYYVVILLEWGCTDGEWGQTYTFKINKTGPFQYSNPSAVKIGQMAPVWNYCGDNSDNQRTWYPKDQSIHNSSSPDGQYYVWDHSGPLVGKAVYRPDTKYNVTADNVNINVDSITFSSNPGWAVGDAVWYNNGGGSSIGGLESYYRDQPLHPNDYWVKTKVGNIITLSDTPNGDAINLTTTGNSNQYFRLANPTSCHDYTKSLGKPAGLGELTIYIPEYWWSHDNDITHPSWFGNNNSFVIGNFASKKNYPSIYDMKIYEYTFDRNTPIPDNPTHREDNLIPRITLLTHKNAAAWEDPHNPAADNGVNYHGGLPSVISLPVFS